MILAKLCINCLYTKVTRLQSVSTATRGLPWWRIGVFIKDGLDPSVVPTKTCTTFENLLIKISLKKESFCFLNIYRPRSSSTPTFSEQFQLLLEDIHHTTEKTGYHQRLQLSPWNNMFKFKSLSLTDRFI